MKLTFLLLALFLVGTTIFGLVLPKTNSAQKTVAFSSAKSLIWEKMRDLSGQVTWRPNVERIEILNATPGKEEWVEYPKQGAQLKFRTILVVEQERWEMETFDSPVLVHWTGILKETNNAGTEIFFEEKATVNNPFFRIFAFLFIDLNKLIEVYSENLKTALQEGSR